MDASGWGALIGAGIGELNDEAKMRAYNNQMRLAAAMLRTSPWSGIRPEMPTLPTGGAGVLSGALSGFQAGSEFAKQADPKLQTPSPDEAAAAVAAEDQIDKIGNAPEQQAPGAPAPIAAAAPLVTINPQTPAMMPAPAAPAPNIMAPVQGPAVGPAMKPGMGGKVPSRPMIAKSGVAMLGAQGGQAPAMPAKIPYYLNPNVAPMAPQNPWDFKMGGY